MRFLTTVRIGAIALLIGLLFCSLVFGQDLNQQKQALIQQVRDIDKQLNDNPSADEYADLIKQRESIEAQLKDVQRKLLADADAMKKINAVKKAFNEALNAYKLGQFQQGIENADRAVATDPTFFKAYYVKGLCLKKLRKTTEATGAFKAALEQNPGYSEAAAELGKLYVAMGQNDKAIGVFDEALQSNSGAYKVYYELGRVYLDQKKDYNKAAQNFSKATQINPNYDLAYLSLGVSLTELNRLDDALLALDNAIDSTKRKRWHTPYYRKAVILNKKGSATKAIAAADQALKLKKSYAPAAYEAGKAAKSLGQFTKAIAYFKTAAKSRQWKRTAEYEIDLIVNRDKYGSE